jgi:hypothetical protein
MLMVLYLVSTMYSDLIFDYYQRSTGRNRWVLDLARLALGLNI